LPVTGFANIRTGCSHAVGGKQLGCPTANLDKNGLGKSLDAIERGIYAGWAMVGTRGPFKAVASVGFNPTYDDVKEKVVEPHLIHDFGDEDFYGETLRFLMVAYLRPEWKLVDAEGGFNYPLLVEVIQNDIKVATSCLDEEKFARFKQFPALSNGGDSASAARLGLAQAFAVGDRIEGRFQGQAEFFPGVVDAVVAAEAEAGAGGGVYRVRYDDGDREGRARGFRLRLPGQRQYRHLEVGEIVDACAFGETSATGGGGDGEGGGGGEAASEFVPGRVSEVCVDGTYCVLFIDGSRGRALPRSRILARCVLAERSAALAAAFAHAPAFDGPREGMTFKRGARGVGYYRDEGPVAAVAVAAAAAAATAGRDLLQGGLGAATTAGGAGGAGGAAEEEEEKDPFAGIQMIPFDLACVAVEEMVTLLSDPETKIGLEVAVGNAQAALQKETEPAATTEEQEQEQEQEQKKVSAASFAAVEEHVLPVLRQYQRRVVSKFGFDDSDEGCKAFTLCCSAWCREKGKEVPEGEDEGDDPGFIFQQQLGQLQLIVMQLISMSAV
jgi:riboflavin kinase